MVVLVTLVISADDCNYNYWIFILNIILAIEKSIKLILKGSSIHSFRKSCQSNAKTTFFILFL